MNNYPPSVNQPYYQPVQKDSTLAILSLIFGISAYVILPVLGSLAAIIMGHIAKSEIRKSNGALTGSGMATAGLVLGYIQWGFILLGLLTIILLVILGPSVSNVFSNINSQLNTY